ncbi:MULTISPECIES: type II toxin-antitoxin system RelE/ParE family toxin [Chryseobacterium]|jgi:plasmid stabilization system protein ParE|uniref:Plasmid stabilisation system protein n=1 Tax=Chryseobacterium balustinum TaxID=246 RepID=A0AAX2IQX8_9FLAO|nr:MULTISPECIES: type II toxin-antitoxin system RelE/ParE family toxin [Chryseobacterium]AZB29492.1 type II toxin-antitoxin system RelE/ParE family toxin [Chryseobacterium balustinum]MDY0932093.1 type II toxin-antitoxin system RelE/ParE family toxin [Chryseobacterium sp. CFBP8996]SKB74368.1 Plasmid stabilization system protein ParE [Chryseobacterium balustinum]SQA92088.1 Plasmid stabilisation system protein [Chryseobacterium balustinum]
MAFEIEYTHHAEIDVAKAIDYYSENASLKVAKFFYKKLLIAEKTLKQTPFFQKIHNDFHRLPLRVFPFIIIYKIEKETIKIFRVFHTSQNPEKYP